MISAEFKKAVQLGDEEKVKIMLKNSLTMDLTFNQFKAMLEYTLNIMPNIVEAHDGTHFESKGKWDKDYTSLLKYDLVDNFSAERIAHIKEVQQYVYADELKKQLQSQSNTLQPWKQPSQQTNPQTATIRTRSTNESNVDSQYIVGLIVALGVGAASILLGVIKGWAIVTTASTAVIASVIAGGITYFIVKK